MQEVTAWLGRLGLEQYAQRFAQHKIEVATLPHLTDQDLKEIEIPLGHRRKILAAIRDRLATPSKPASSDLAERRQVTVVFVDLVGSTQLSQGMDPEDLREIISGYHRSVTATVQRFGGFVARYMGDGVLVYFGYPEAHEDDPDRGVRAALEITSTVSELPGPRRLQARVGIATGVVVVGDLIGSGERFEPDIVGETANLAARLQAIAAPNTVVIGDGTRRLLGNLFALQDLGQKQLKGIQEGARAWVVLRPNPVASRFEALHAGAIAPLVGREEELRLLHRRWTKAKNGEGQVVLLSGEAGIGKSRLVFELLQRLATEPHVRLRYTCSPQHTDSTLYPIITQLAREAEFEEGDTSRTKLDKLEALLARYSTHSRDVFLIAQLLSLSNPGDDGSVGTEPHIQRQETLRALCSQLEARTRADPALIFLEDAHWIDPTSLELFNLVIGMAASRRLLVIVTFRPEFNPPWAGRAHVTALTVNRLASPDVDRLIQQITQGRPLTTTVWQDIIRRTDGIPLFVEEMTKAVLDESETQGIVAGASTPLVTVPASLQASLMSRLDRLGRAKELAQLGAAIGREFPHMLLAAVAAKPDAELMSELDRLIAAGLLFRQGTAPDATYWFKHALVQDAAYSTLLREPRRALHARIAEALERRFPEVAESQPELVARHYTKAELFQNSARLWGKAGLRSQERTALAEAAEQLGQALSQMAALPSTPELRREQIVLQVALMNTLMHVKGYGSAETKAAVAEVTRLIDEAEQLGESLEDESLLLSALFGGWIVNFIRFDGDRAKEIAARFLNSGKKAYSLRLVVGHRTMASSLALIGDLTQARRHYDQALALYRPAEHRRFMTRFGQDLRVTCLGFRSMALWLLGYPDAAIEDADCALAEARQIGHAATLMFTLNFPIIVNTYCGNYARAYGLVDELVELAEQKGAAFRQAEGVLRRGYIATLAGSSTEAVQMVSSGISLWRSAGSTIFAPEQETMLAFAYARSGQFDAAWRCVREAIASMERTSERWCEAEVYRVAGEITLLSAEQDVSKARAYLNRALAISRSQQARAWELRAATSMARLLCRQHEPKLAYEVLAPAYDWFTEGFGTRDLQDAKSLLSNLQ